MLRKWKSYAKAFPDMECECMKGMMIPTRCSKCGADRTQDNWESNQSSTTETPVKIFDIEKNQRIPDCEDCGNPGEEQCDECGNWFCIRDLELHVCEENQD